MTEFEPRLTLAKNSEGRLVGDPVDAALSELADEVVKVFSVDPLIIELVRLRCAQVHDCRFCKSVRLNDAIGKGLNEEMAAKIARYETSDLGDAAIAALRLCDSIIMAPAVAADAGLAAQLRRHFTEGQIAELCLQVMKWSQQKVQVALRIEAPVAPELSLLSFGQDGRATVTSGAAYR